YRLIAVNGAGTALGGDRAFTTPAIAPALASPSANAINQPVNLIVRWRTSPGASSYRVEVSRNPFFIPIAFQDTALSDTFRQVGTLSHNTTYYWHVGARNVAGNISW